MNPIWPALRAIADDLRELGVPHALVGGLAVSARVEPRFTRGVDLAVSVADDASAEALVRALLARGYRVVALVEHEARGRIATVRLVPPQEVADGAVIDLLCASSGIEAEIVAGADVLALGGGLRTAVASAGHLIARKLLSTVPERPADEQDLQRLIACASASELDVARGAVAAIEARGYARGRALSGDLERRLRAR